MPDIDDRAQRAFRRQFDCANLTPERERELLCRARHGETMDLREQAMQALWESHSKLVVGVASRYRRSGIELSDLVGAGHLGLHTAIARFDPAREQNRLAAYAAGWIRWHILDYIRRNTALVRLPESQGHRQLSQMTSRLLADARRLCLRDGVEPTDEELCHRIAARVGLEPAEVASSLRLLQSGTLSLDHHREDSSSEFTLGATLVDDNATSEDDHILRLDQEKARHRVLQLADEVLSDRERIVFLARCMTRHEAAVPLAALAARLGISRERVHQLAESARRKIAATLLSEGYAAGDGSTAGRPLPRKPGRRDSVPTRSVSHR
jgi:RNA polymerase sigma factor (sigma-70 family)